MISYYINSKRIYIDENDYSIIFINKPIGYEPIVDKEHTPIGDKRIGDKEHKPIGDKEHNPFGDSDKCKSNKVNIDLDYTIDNSYYNFSIKPTQLEESMIVFK